MNVSSSRTIARLDSLLTSERRRVYPLMLIGMFVLLWGIRTVAAPSSLLPDFKARWTAGTMVQHGQSADLYNALAQSVVQRSDGSHSLSWFVSPPPVALLFAPLGALPYTVAALMWLAVCLAGLALGVQLLRPFWPASWGPYWHVVVIVVACQPLFELIGSGQDSWLVLLSGIVGWRLWRADRTYLAGLALVVGAIVKPQLMLAAFVLVLVYGGMRMLAALVFGVIGISVASLPIVGPSVWTNWMQTVSSGAFTDQVTFGQAHKSASLQGLAIAIAPAGAARFAASLGLAAGILLLICWATWLIRTRPPQWVWLSTGVFVTVLAAPHAMVYDLVLVLPAIAVVVRQMASPALRVTIAGGFVAVCVGPVLSLLRSQPWPISALSAQWAILVPLVVTIRLIALDRFPATPLGATMGHSRVSLRHTTPANDPADDPPANVSSDQGRLLKGWEA